MRPGTLLALIFIGAFNARTCADEFPIRGLQFNPASKAEVLLQKNFANGGFNLSAAAGAFAIEIKGTPMKSEAAALAKNKVEMANLKNLYRTRGNPYQGQISEYITCEPAFAPKFTTFRLRGQEVKGLLGGASERKLFGVCNHDQIAFWGGYFTFYDREGSLQIDVRVFHKFSEPAPGKVKKVSALVREFSEKLFVPAEPRP